MRNLLHIVCFDLKKRSRDGFIIGYNIIFPIVMIILLGYLSSESYGKDFTGYHYYMIVILSFSVAMAVITAAFAGKDDAYKKTAVRYLFSPISKSQIVLAKLISCTLVISCCNLLVLLFSHLVFKIPLNMNIIPVTLILAAETFTVCAIGLFIGLGMKNFIFIKNVLNIPICLAAILGGAFFPLGTLNERLEMIIKLSPLTWVNRSIFLMLYDDSSQLIWKTTLIFFVTGIGFAILAVILFKKEEFIHGDLPGYEK